MAGFYKWCVVQKVIHAIRLLRGPAKIFVNYERWCRNWSEMKQALRAEFSQVVAHKIHKVLSRRIKKFNETYQQSSRMRSRRTEEKTKGTIRREYEHTAFDCNGDETKTTAALVPKMGAGETLQIDRDGNFLMPQVDGPANLLLSGDDEESDKIDLTENPVLENQEDSQVADFASMEQDADATSTEFVNMSESSIEDPETSLEGASELPVSTSAAENIPVSGSADPEPSVVDAQSDENEIPIEVPNDPETVNEIDMQDMNEASAEEAQVKPEISSMQDPIEASSEEASMPDAMELRENDESERIENNDIKLMAVDTYSSEPETICS